MLWTRDEYLSHMTFQGSPREMFTELFGPLIGLDEEWRSQGATEDEVSLTAFGWDGVLIKSAPYRVGAVTGIEPHVLEDNDRETVSVDSMGRKMRLSKKCATLPLPFSYPVETADDWFDKVRGWYAFSEERFNKEELIKLKKFRDEGGMVSFSMPGGFDEPRGLMGEENLCYAYYDEPEMMEDMMQTFGDIAVKGLERVLDVVPVDILCVHEDMAGISGPMVGPNHVKQFMCPYYSRVWKLAKQGGAKLFSQDSDGNISSLIDVFLDAGINCMYPAEPKAGMDIVALRQKYGKRVAFKGGIDKFALRGTKEDIDRELDKKMCAVTMGGGTCFGLDHRIPNGVSIENYRYYVAEGRKRLGREAATPSKHIRMAF